MGDLLLSGLFSVWKYIFGLGDSPTDAATLGPQRGMKKRCARGLSVSVPFAHAHLPFGEKEGVRSGVTGRRFQTVGFFARCLARSRFNGASSLDDNRLWDCQRVPEHAVEVLMSQRAGG